MCGNDKSDLFKTLCISEREVTTIKQNHVNVISFKLLVFSVVVSNKTLRDKNSMLDSVPNFF